MDNFYEELAEIRDAVEKKLQHPYLEKHIGEPAVDDDKLVLLYSILIKANVPFARIKKYIVTLFLVQSALDTHDRVTLSRRDDTDEDLLNRQLTVLAGDYYSGLYYYLLAQNSDLQLIQLFAGAIRKINEYKISIYQKNQLTIDFFMKRIAQIESTLILQITDLFQLPELKDLTTKVCLLKRLLAEKESFVSYGVSDFVANFQLEKGMNFPEQCLFKFDTYINKTMDEIERFMNYLPIHPALHERLDILINPSVASKQKVLEEG